MAAAIKVIDDERGVTAYINPAAISMWRPHWTGPGLDEASIDAAQLEAQLSLL